MTVFFLSVVVYHYNPTSNRNLGLNTVQILSLYIIIILHQTATILQLRLEKLLLYIIIILHQTATYAKALELKEQVVYHYNPTSNRNYRSVIH